MTACSRVVAYPDGKPVSGNGGQGGGGDARPDPLSAAWNRLLQCHQPTPCDDYDAYAFEHYGMGAAAEACVTKVLAHAGEAQLRTFLYDEATSVRPEWNLFVFPDRSVVVWKGYWGSVGPTVVSVCQLKDETYFAACSPATCADPSSWFAACADADIGSLECH